MRLTFLGAAREVTGSMLLVETAGGSVLVDCGMFQGRRAESRARNRTLPRAALTADAALLTHAHVDHSGSLPVLVRDGFAGAIHTTPATRDLCAVMLRDAARIQVADADYLNRRYGEDPEWTPIEPIYDEDAVVTALGRMVGHPYGQRFAPVPGVEVTFIDAGHILGSAQVVLDVDERGRRHRLVVSGDLGRSGMPIIRDPAVPPRPIDTLVMESTYGGRRHGPMAAMATELATVLARARASGGKVLVPAFALGRTQELLAILHGLGRAGDPIGMPVFIDSPLAIDVTSVFRLHPECFDAETRAALDGDDPFAVPNLTMTRTREASMAINDVTGPALIIAASGMCEGGRVLHHLRNLVEDPTTTIVTIGFMAQHTLGRRLVERRPQVKIWGVARELHAQVVTLDGFSAHADTDDLEAYARGCAATTTFLVHGEPEGQTALAAALAGHGLAIQVPERGAVVER
ncbi:MAG: MBL fold metallo-hydrolase [Myxococcales bacterium]|nr:MBL fold metallo-hydrolase [Myxococcales bacterium]